MKAQLALDKCKCCYRNIQITDQLLGLPQCSNQRSLPTDMHQHSHTYWYSAEHKLTLSHNSVKSACDKLHLLFKNIFTSIHTRLVIYHFGLLMGWVTGMKGLGRLLHYGVQRAELESVYVPYYTFII